MTGYKDKRNYKKKSAADYTYPACTQHTVSLFRVILAKTRSAPSSSTEIKALLSMVPEQISFLTAWIETANYLLCPISHEFATLRFL